MAMHQDPQQSATSGDQSAFGGPAVDDHGRVVTATIRAAAFYRQAQQAGDARDALAALRLAVSADPRFQLALADLGAMTQAPPAPISGRQMNWERHHLEVVRTAAAGNLRRAAGLLREHLASVGCDPLALRIVTDLQRRAEQPSAHDHLGNQALGCHPPWAGLP